MTISVVIPAYNEEKYLPKTLESLKTLDRRPDEVIVIDGGSTDDTANVARDHRARLITIDHRGIGYARQKGLEAATGDIVAFTDADTVVSRDWLTKIETALAHPGVVGVYSGFRVPDGWFPYWFFINYIQPISSLFSHYVGIPMAPGQNTAFLRTKGLEVGGYPIDFKIAEDLEMARRLRTAGKLVYLSNNYVTSSGRRGDEGFSLLLRIFKAFLIYFFTRRADKIGFPDIR